MSIVAHSQTRALPTRSRRRAFSLVRHNEKADFSIELTTAKRSFTTQE
jgi:hypothetical protein